MQECLDRMNLPDYVLEILKCSKGVIVPKTRTDLFELAMGNVANTTFDVDYEVDGLGTVLEATVTKCKNGAVVNSIQTIREGSYGKEEKKEQLDIVQSFSIVVIRNIIGSFLGGAQTGSLWRSFLIPLYMVKRPMRKCAVLLGVLGIIASLTMIPIQIMSYPPLV